jgi:hypothetical protein
MISLRGLRYAAIVGLVATIVTVGLVALSVWQ